MLETLSEKQYKRGKEEALFRWRKEENVLLKTFRRIQRKLSLVIVYKTK